MRLAAAAMGLAACQPGSGPTIDQITPAQAMRGATVTLHGDGFCGAGRDAGDGTCTTLPPGAVDFGLELPAARATILSWSEGAIDVTVPSSAGIGATDVIVTVDGRSSNCGAFEVLP